MNVSIWTRVGLAAALVSVSACSRTRAATDTPDIPTVAVATIVRGDIAERLTVAAAFRPFQEVDLHAKVAGYVKAIYVDVGDRVHAGQLIAVLEVPELQNELQQDEAAVKRAQEEVNRAQADLVRAESVHEVASLAANRLSSVLKVRPNLVAQQDIDEATGRDRVADAQAVTAQAALASAREQLEVTKAGEEKTKTLLAYAQITAPFAGVITNRYADIGAMIQAGTSSQTQAMPLVKLSQNSLLRLVIPVPESAVARIRLGAGVDLKVDALHRGFQGTVARFADRLDTETRTMRVEVDVPNPNLQIVPGMYADVSLVLDKATHVLVAPIEAIDRSGGTPHVLVVGPDRQVQMREVALGLETADRVEIAKGLQEGDLAVVGSRGQLSVGTLVVPKVMASAPAEDAR